ncbi:hypothetical protein KIPB_009856 [Kipferlia bialata]|uniref:Uncharacterized protein n=1 Tax=Kipferlia bialata TaxID=797122 RepID=A0A9K3D5P2_9EUKA|nr:hypothetical protein KIPB_009856 [Kipferlia bialata]|eukprot:g9856.t1
MREERLKEVSKKQARAQHKKEHKLLEEDIMLVVDWAKLDEEQQEEVLAARAKQMLGKCSRALADVKRDPESELDKVEAVYKVIGVLMTPNPDHALRVAEHAYETLGEVFALLTEAIIDVFPNYRIVLPNADAMMSRDVQIQAKYDMRLLALMERYLTTLEAILPRQAPLSTYGALNMGKILTAMPDFNLRDRIIKKLIPVAGNMGKNPARPVAAEALRLTVVADTKGWCALEIARSISKVAVKKNFRIHPDIIECLLAISPAGVTESINPANMGSVRRYVYKERE